MAAAISGRAAAPAGFSFTTYDGNLVEIHGGNA